VPEADPRPIFEHVGIVGCGVIGGSLGLAIKRRWAATRIVAIDRPEIVRTALQIGAADAGAESLTSVAGASLIVLAAPVRANIAILERLPEALANPAVVTDVGSTKAATIDAAAALPDRFQFIGGHPLAGTALGGVREARAELFDERPWLLTPNRSTRPDTLSSLRRFVEGVGARPVEIPALEHDRLVAYLSHLPQLTVTALMHVVGNSVGREGLALAGLGLRDTTRLASSPPDIWRDIVATNATQVSAALDALIDVLTSLKRQAAQPHAVFDQLFASAARWKQTLDEQE
jgi:prephenate dehydrogenase